MFPELPQDLTALTDEELAATLAEFLAVVGKVKARDEETLGELSAEEIMAEMTAGVEAIEEIKAESKTRAEAEANFAASLDELASRAGVESAKEEPEAENGDTEPDEAEDAEETDAEEAEAVEEKVAVTAGTKPVRRPLPKSARHRPRAAAQQEGAPLIASTFVYGLTDPGEHLNMNRLSQVYTDLIRKNRLQPKQKVVVASATFPFPDDRHLDKDWAGVWQKISAVTSPQALVASGGLCNPVENVYSMPDIETSSRPVRDALANFRADRGGANIPANPTITDYADAVGVVTAEDDAEGGTFALKNCMRIECPVFTETQVDSIYRCVEAGNLTARAYPELMARISTLVMANHARAAEGVLLDTIKAGSTAVTPVNTATAGGIWEFFFQVGVAASGFRSRHRMGEGAVVKVLLPEWIVDALKIDLARSQFDRFPAREAITGYLRQFNVNVTYYKDTPSTGTSQLFDAQTAGAQDDFPADVQWAMYPEGSWLHLDSGSLDLGIVRDSTLNSTNDFQIFAETWEQAALIGVESQWLTSTLCFNGTVSAPKDLSSICND